MSTPTVLVHRDPAELAAAVAARLITRLVDVQSSRGEASLVLTGGGIAAMTLEAVAASSARGAVDWSRLDVWWGDERFLPAGRPGAQRDRWPARRCSTRSRSTRRGCTRCRASDGPDGDDPDAAAARYADELAPRRPARGPRPGARRSTSACSASGPDGHIASLFPEHPALYDDRPVVAVRDCPQAAADPDLARASPVIQGSREVWVVVAGEDKATAVALALSGAGQTQVPAAGAHGRDRTLWLLDKAAAGRLPATPRPDRLSLSVRTPS